MPDKEGYGSDGDSDDDGFKEDEEDRDGEAVDMMTEVEYDRFEGSYW